MMGCIKKKSDTKKIVKHTKRIIVAEDLLRPRDSIKLTTGSRRYAKSADTIISLTTLEILIKKNINIAEKIKNINNLTIELI
jgi:hypothetical protein